MFFVSRRASHRLRAFTLIEMLIVVVIIALLAALLFPVFNSVRSAGRITTCQSNLRQIGMAMQLYQNDYNRFYPDLRTPPPGCSWSSNIAHYTKGDAVFTCPEAPNKVFQSGCPSVKREGDVTTSFRGGYSFDVPYGPTQLSELRIKMPSQMISVIDGDGDKVSAPLESGPLSRADLENMVVALRHKDGANALFVDGHVKWMSLDALTDRSHWTLSGRG